MRNMRKGKKLTASILVMIMVLALFAIPALASTPRPIDFITLPSDDFTVVGLSDTSDFLTARAVVGGVSVPFDPSEYSSIEWEVEPGDEGIVQLVDANEDEVSVVTGQDSVEVVLLDEGIARVNVTYTQPNSTTTTVFSNIVVQNIARPTPTVVEDIVLNVDFTSTAVDNLNNPLADITNLTVDVPYFTLNSVFGPSFDDADVLTKDITAMHALVYGLEVAFGNSDPIANGWSWVPANINNLTNVVIDGQGSYLFSIGSDEAAWPNGWQYNVGGSGSFYNAASIQPIVDDDVVNFFYAPY